MSCLRLLGGDLLGGDSVSCLRLLGGDLLGGGDSWRFSGAAAAALVLGEADDLRFFLDGSPSVFFSLTSFAAAGGASAAVSALALPDFEPLVLVFLVFLPPSAAAEAGSLDFLVLPAFLALVPANKIPLY